MILKILFPNNYLQEYEYEYKGNRKIEIGSIMKAPIRDKQKIGVVVNIPKEADFKGELKIANPSDYKKLPLKEYKFLKYVSDYNLIHMGKMLKMAISPIIKQQTPKKEENEDPPSESGINLIKEQIKCYKNIKTYGNNFNVILMDGKTGSGKTEIYLKTVFDKIKNGGQALIMLPEISIISEIAKRVEKYFKIKPHIWNASITPSKKRDAYHAITNGDAKIVIGTRSSLFIPFCNLKIIIIDEEHDTSYKQEEQSIYNARDMAILKSKILDIPIILSSATPSIESINNAICGKYKYIKIDNRYNAKEMPKIELVEKPIAPNKIINDSILKKIESNIKSSDTTLVFFNKRGYASVSECTECHTKIECNNCDQFLIYHKHINKISCHKCGFMENFSNQCANCNKKNTIKHHGIGVEKIKEYLEEKFKTAKIEIFASDNLNTPKKTAKMIDEIINGKIDIVIGTQMIAKGHNFPSLKTVIVIDTSFKQHGADFRAFEKTFQTIIQVAGRAGRFNKQGEVYIQTDDIKHDVLKNIQSYDYTNFINNEIKNREAFFLPPFTKMSIITAKSHIANKALITTTSIKKVIEKFDKVGILGPFPAPIFFLKNKYQYMLMLKYPKNYRIQNILSKINLEYDKNVKIKIDIDPMNFQ